MRNGFCHPISDDYSGGVLAAFAVRQERLVANDVFMNVG